MQAVVIHETGGPDVLGYEEVPDPEPADGEVLVRLTAVGVNHYDLTRRAGAARKLPAILGGDGAGTRVDTGERVLVTNAPGTYAELVAVPDANVYSLPDAVDDTAAAAIGVPYRTAWWAVVELGGLAEGKTLLVQAAASATGQACVDVGRARAPRVYATASPAKVERVRELGADAFPYGDARIEELEADVVFDPVGADTFASSVAALAREGTLVTPGALGDSTVSFDVWALVGKQARIQGTGSAPARRDILERLIALAADGKLRPVIDRELPLERAADAHRAIEARETFGKVILRP